MMLKEDCYWYYEEHDMGARLPFCKLKKGCNPIEPEDCANCDKYHSRYTRTNADRIRSMSDEELAGGMITIMQGWCPRKASDCVATCKECLLDWLKQEA